MPEHISEEVVVPVIIKHVTIDTAFGRDTYGEKQYHNAIVRDLNAIRYIQNPRRSDNYVREASIVRHYDEAVTWPEHPLNMNGKILGAIVIIHSRDDKILLVRNRKLWGLPKGARNYTDFIRCKSETDRHFRQTGEILTHESAEFTADKIESAVDNVYRETLEETGIIMDRSQVREIHEHWGGRCAYDAFYYAYPKDADKHGDDLKRNGTDHENDELLWVDLMELEQWLRNHRSPNHPKIFNHITYGILDEFLHKSNHT